MKSRFRMMLTSLALVSALAFGGSSLASADTVTPSRYFGEHASMMATEGHPLPSQHGGQHFGGCISDMAQGGTCPDMH